MRRSVSPRRASGIIDDDTVVAQRVAVLVDFGNYSAFHAVDAAAVEGERRCLAAKRWIGRRRRRGAVVIGREARKCPISRLLSIGPTFPIMRAQTVAPTENNPPPAINPSTSCFGSRAKIAQALRNMHRPKTTVTGMAQPFKRHSYQA